MEYQSYAKMSSRGLSMLFRHFVVAAVHILILSSSVRSFAQLTVEPTDAPDLVQALAHIPSRSHLPHRFSLRSQSQGEVQPQHSMRSVVIQPKGSQEDIACGAKRRRKLRGQNFSTALSSNSISNITDREALLAFSAALDASSKAILSTWNAVTSPNVCSGWEGVTCNSAGRVIALDLSGKRLSGTIVPMLGNLSLLTGLNLYNNSFYGEIPTSLGLCRALTTVNLGGNVLSGPIPVQLANLGELTSLNMSQNKLIDIIPVELGTLIELETLDLSRNCLTGPIPGSLGNLTNLVNLDLDTNQLIGSIPTDLGALTNLKTLVLMVNNLTGPIPTSLQNLTNLVGLDLRENRLTGGVIPELGRLQNLQLIDLSGNILTGSIPPTFSNLTTLRYLDLGNNSLSGQIPTLLGYFKNLEMLCLFSNQITGSIPPMMGNLTNRNGSWQSLQYLYLSQNKINGTIPPEIGNLNLKVLSLGENRLSGEIPASLKNCQNLILVNLSLNLLHGVVPQWLGENPSLQILDLHSNTFHGQIPPLRNCTDLRLLFLQRNLFTGPISVNFSRMLDLALLDLSYNSLSDTIPNSLEDLDKLESLDLSHNNLYGTIPPFSKELDALRLLDLSSNNLEGEVPSWVWGLPKLQILDLSNNSFSGNITDEVIVLGGMSNVPDVDSTIIAGVTFVHCWTYYSGSGSSAGYTVTLEQFTWGFEEVDAFVKGNPTTYVYILPSLAYIDLSMNKFTGEIPSGLGTLQVMKALNLSHNLFTGSVSDNLGYLGALESLDVSDNNLSGPIPSTIVNLYSLSTLNMAYNNFSGCIPSGGQLDTFVNSSFKPGNEGLSGFPVSNYCLQLETSNSTAGEDPDDYFLDDFLSFQALEIGFALGFFSVLMLLVMSGRSREALLHLVKLPPCQLDGDSPQNIRSYGVYRERDWGSS